FFCCYFCCLFFYLALSVCVHLQYDPENSGFISTERFRDLLATHGSELDPHKLEVLLALADGNADGKICYQDFVNLMSNKRSNSFRRAILQGSRQLKGCSLRDEVGLGLSQRLVRHVAYETLPREVDRKWYFDSYTYCPPPLLILAITIVAVFMYYGFQLDRLVLQVSSPSFLKSPLPYHPQLRAQAWRYLSYCFMHTGIEHLSLNMAMQLLVGVPLEMVHGALRIGLVYVCGVLAGEVSGVSVTDMTAPVVGSSGGVYALVSHVYVTAWEEISSHCSLLYFDICACSVWSVLLLWVITHTLCVIGCAVDTSVWPDPHNILRVRMEELIFLLSAEIILSNTARSDWGSECLWGFQN
uniref:rhomboid protease n=1 Tax=Lates calcarifer TaxID=8187 RepID=A0A4W6FFH9_LATCA